MSESLSIDKSRGPWLERLALRRLRTWHSDRIRVHSDDALRALVRRGCEQARSYGFRSLTEIMLFLDSVVILADELRPDSPNRDAIGLLTDAAAAPAARASALLLYALTTASRRRARTPPSRAPRSQTPPSRAPRSQTPPSRAPRPQTPQPRALQSCSPKPELDQIVLDPL